MEIKNSLSVSQLLNETSCRVPLYQRNFSWTERELEQLIRDVMDAEEEGREHYYIGTLVVHEKNHQYDVIDGQQRTTALTLLGLVLKKEYGCPHLKKLNLSFEARAYSNQTLQVLFDGKETDATNELTLGYDIIKQLLAKKFSSNQDLATFADYLFHRVIIFKNQLPTDLDLNLYFERFNSRGEQLEAHEIIKAQMMAILAKDNEELSLKFARIWEACAHFNRPVITFFAKKTKHSSPDSEREKIFPSVFQNHYTFRNLFKICLSDDFREMTIKPENRQSLLEVLQGSTQVSGMDSLLSQDEVPGYRTIVNFETFLYYAFYLTTGKEEIQLDDKKLLKTFETELVREDARDFVIRFARTLLQLKHVFDHLIVRRSLETSTSQRRQEDGWFLQKVYRTDVNEKKRGHGYVQYRFDKNSFDHHNQEILMLQSMFAVTFTANRDSKWLFEILRFLVEDRHLSRLHEETFGADFLIFLEGMAMTYAQDRLFFGHRLKGYLDKVPVYAFNFVDYVLWTKRAELKDRFFNVEQFRFAERSSIEHWYPQNPDTATNMTRLPDEALHAFGNLCLVTNRQNSRFGNLTPSAKYQQWQNIFDNQSLKLQWMAKVTKGQDDQWQETSIQACEREVMKYVREFMEVTQEKLARNSQETL